MEFVKEYFERYCLTTHCKGDTGIAVSYLSRYYQDSNSLERLRKIKATNWQTLKTEGINFSCFYWIDDAPFESEKEYLK